MTSLLAKGALNLMVLLALAFSCKTADVKNTRKLEQERGEGNALTEGFRLHQEFIKAVFTAAKREDVGHLWSFMSKNKSAIAVDFYNHQTQYKEILKQFNEQGIITKTKADSLQSLFDTLATLGANRVGRAAASPVFNYKIKNAANDIYKVVSDDLREKGLVSFLETVFKMVTPADENGKRMFNMMFMYFDHTLNADSGLYKDSVNRKLGVVEDAAISILQDSRGQPIDLWTAMIEKKGKDRLIEIMTAYKGTNGITDADIERVKAIQGTDAWRLKLDEIAGKGLFKVMEESGPVMTKILQSYVEDMPPDMQAAVRKVQSDLPPLSPDVSADRFKELDIRLDEARYQWPSASDKAKIQSMVDDKKVFSYTQGGVERFYTNSGTASLSDSKVLYLKNKSGEIEEVVVKFIKRDAVTRYEQELKFFNEPGRFTPGVKRALDLYINAIPGELDLNDEIKNMDRIKNGGLFTQQGVDAGGGQKLDFDVVNQPSGIRFNTQTGHFKGAGHAMIMNKAQGKPINKWVKIRQNDVNDAKSLLEAKYISIEKGQLGFETSQEYQDVQRELKQQQEQKSKTDYNDPNRKTLEAEIKANTEKLESLAKGLDEFFPAQTRQLQQAMTKLEELESVVKGIYRQWMISAFSKGSFHPDPHQGNIFIDLPEGGGPAKVTFIDVGGTVEVSSEVRFGFLNLLTSLQFKDYDKALRSLKEICSLKCRHLSGDLKQLDPKGDISELVASDDTPLQKIEKLLKATNDVPMRFDKSFGDLAKAQGIMLKTVNSVHKKTVNATKSHHLLNKKIEGIDDITTKVFKVDLRSDFASTLVADALNAYAGKIFKIKYLSLPAIVTAAGLGAFFGDEVDMFTLAATGANSSHSCVIDDGSYSVCITYGGLEPSAFEKLKHDCQETKEGLWLKNNHSCSGYGEEFYGCNLGLQTVSYAINQNPVAREFDFACRSFSDLTKRLKFADN